MKKLIFILALILAATTVEAGPFAPTAKHYKTKSYKKFKPSRKTDAFVCVKHKKVNRKGLMR